MALASLGLVQFSSSAGRDDFRSRAIVLNRLLGIPVLVLVGLLSGVQSQWMLAGLLGVMVAELIGDMAISASPESSTERESVD